MIHYNQFVGYILFPLTSPRPYRVLPYRMLRDRNDGEQEKDSDFDLAWWGQNHFNNQFFSSLPMRSSGKGAGGWVLPQGKCIL